MSMKAPTTRPADPRPACATSTATAVMLTIAERLPPRHRCVYAEGTEACYRISPSPGEPPACGPPSRRTGFNLLPTSLVDGEDLTLSQAGVEISPCK